MQTTKVFKSGGSQAVRIPKELRLDSETVYIKKTALGLLITPRTDSFWDDWLTELRAHQWDVSAEDIEDTPEQERDWDALFT